MPFESRFLLVVSSTLSLPFTAHGQEAAPSGVEEVVVTAQKREQSAQEVPMSIGVVTGELVEQYGAVDLSQVQATVPGLTMVNLGVFGGDTIIMRGISPPAGLPSVGEYVDDLAISGEQTGFGLDFPLVDINRVEILKGPQGTLYGEGSIGGTIKYFTNTPSLDGDTHGQADVTGTTVDGGNQGWRASLAGDLPIQSDRFGVRLAGYYEDSPGWVDNAFKGSDANGAKRWLLRGRARMRPVDSLTIDLSYQHSGREMDVQGFSAPDYNSNYFTDRPSKSESDLYGLNISWEVGNTTLSSVTGYQKRTVETAADISNFLGFVETTFPGTTILAPAFGNPFTVANPISNVTYNNDYDIETFTQELRAVGSLSDQLQYTAGVFYKDSSYSAPTTSTPYPDSNALPIALFGGSLASSTESYSVFGELTYQITSRFEATGGLRYYRDKRESDQHLISFGVPSPLVDSMHNDAVVPRVVLKYAFNDDLMTYVSASQGFRSGGFQSLDVEPFGISNSFDPEELTTYELGSKGSLLNGVLTYEAAAFFTKYQDVQVYVPNPIGLQLFGNEGEADVRGFELNGTWHVSDEFFLQAAFGYNDSEYKSGGLTHDPGDPMDFVPEKTYSASANYTVPLWGNTSGRLRLDYMHQDERPAILRNFGYPNPVTWFDAIDQLNARFGLDLGRASVELFVENVTNEDGQVTKPYGSVAEGMIQQPRTVGVTIRTSF
jgi:outer membrane receptor protein involved in Fe transport